jgi:hypothetical protein
MRIVGLVIFLFTWCHPVLTSCFAAIPVPPKTTLNQRGRSTIRPYNVNNDIGFMLVDSTPEKTRWATTRKLMSSVSGGGDDTAAQHSQLQPLFSWSKLDRKILAIALPCIVNFAINPLIGAIDLFWVGRMNNPLAVAGQAAANQVFNSAFWLVSVLPSVTATLVSEVYATGNKQKVKETVGQSFFLSALIGIPFTLYLLSKPGELTHFKKKFSKTKCHVLY